MESFQVKGSKVKARFLVRFCGLPFVFRLSFEFSVGSYASYMFSVTIRTLNYFVVTYLVI
jgi:hypothetical protein